MISKLGIYRLAFLLFYLLAATYAVHWLGPNRLMSDFSIYAAAAHSAQSGVSAYFPYNIGLSFIYHPVVLSMLSLLLTLGDQLTFVIWSIASALAYFWMVWRVYLRWGNWITLLLILFAPFLEQLFVGQINSFVALALVLTWQFAERKRDTYAGAALAVAMVLKLSPALLLVYFIARRRWRVLWGAVAMLVVLTLVSVLQFGTQPLLDFISVTLQTSSGAISDTRIDIGLLALMLRLHVPGALLVYRFLLVGLTGVLTWLAWRRASVFTFSLLVLVMLELSPLVWLHHFVLIVVVLAIAPFRRSFLLPISAVLMLIQAERLLNHFDISGAFSILAVLLLGWLCWRELSAARSLESVTAEPIVNPHSKRSRPAVTLRR